MREKNYKSNPKKRSKANRFQPKVLIIWLIIFTTIIGFWSITANSNNTPKQWKISHVIQEIKKGTVIKGVLEYDRSGGDQFYTIRGQSRRPSFISKAINSNLYNHKNEKKS